MKKLFIVVIIYLIVLFSGCLKQEAGNSTVNLADGNQQEITSKTFTDSRIDIYSDSYYLISEDGVFLKAEPDASSDDLGVIPDNAQVEILEYIGEMIAVTNRPGRWARIKYNNMEGYCFSAFLRIKQEQKLFIFPEHTPIELFKLPGDYIRPYGVEIWPIEIPDSDNSIMFIDDFLNGYNLIIANLENTPTKIKLTIEAPYGKSFTKEYLQDDITIYAEGDYSGEKYSPSLKIIRLFFNASMKPGTYTIKADLEGSSIESLSSEYYYNAAGPDILEDYHEYPHLEWFRLSNVKHGEQLWLFGTSTNANSNIIVALYRRYTENDFNSDIFLNIDRFDYYSYLLPQGAANIVTDSLGQYAVPFILGEDLESETYYSATLNEDFNDLNIFGFWWKFHVE